VVNPTDAARQPPSGSLLRQTERMSPQVNVEIVRAAPKDAEVVGVPVGSTGPVPRQLGLSRPVLEAHGFEGKPGQTLVVPSAAGPTIVAVGIGDPAELTPADLRDAGAALARAVGKRTSLVTTLADQPSIDPAVAAQAVAEGALLAAYKYDGYKSIGSDTATGDGANGADGAPGAKGASGASGSTPATAAAGNAPANGSTDGGLSSLTLVVPEDRAGAARSGAERARATAAAAALARDLANSPPSHMTARNFADRAVAIANDVGLGVEVFNRDQLAAMGCGGIVGVNAGSTEPPRMIRLTYTPKQRTAATRHLVYVGKGVMYDSGGISLKPSDGMHAKMKMDMSGAAAVLATMSALPALGCKTAVTGYMMCTDNMPSGSAMKLGDVLRFRNGKTAEIHNTDAEGRLVLADGLSLGVEAKPDAIVDIATLTGAVLAALGPKMAGVLGNDQGFVDQVRAAAERADEPLWQLPLAKEYRKLLDSNVADMKNVGGPYGGAITAALFLSEFVGDTPWAHLDIAGPMDSETDDGWLSKGATGFGTRTLIELALAFRGGDLDKTRSAAAKRPGARAAVRR
jgi:leucyl aminopeptidase